MERYFGRLGFALALLVKALFGVFVQGMPLAVTHGALVRWLARVFWCLDILINVLRGGSVETMSSAMGKSITANKQCLLCKLLCGALDVFWKNHCIHNVMEPLIDL